MASEVPLADLPKGVPGPGTLFDGKCRVDRVIGVGGMGAVLAATHLHLNQRVAIKIMLPELARNPEIVSRFLREGRASVRIRSPHVARVLDVSTLPSGEPYMLMELLEGADLGRVLAIKGRCSVREAVDYVLEACEALAEAHKKGIVHRDLKPANLFVAKQEDGTEILKVLDFGISKIDDGVEGEGGMSMTKSRSMLGSPLYMSPEQLRGARDVDARTDVWSLGVILYELASGKPPFDAETVAELGALVLAGSVPELSKARPDAPPAFVCVVERCLSKDRALRWQSIVELAEALAPFATEARGARALKLGELWSKSARSTAISSPDLQSVASSAPTVAAAKTKGEWSTSTFDSRSRSRSFALALVATVGVATVGGVLVALQSRPADITVAIPPAIASAPASAQPAVAEPAVLDAAIASASATAAPSANSSHPETSAPAKKSRPKPPPRPAASAAPAPAAAAATSDRFQ